MNIADRPRYYAEMQRVLRPAGRLAIQDVAHGQWQPLDFPVMWADRPEISFLRTPEDTRAMLEAAGFRVLKWIDNTEASLAEAEADRNRIADSQAGSADPRYPCRRRPRFPRQDAQRPAGDGRGAHRLINAVLARD